MKKNNTERSVKDNLRVLFEDNHIIAINKRPGDIVQSDKTGDSPLSDIVKEYIRHKYNKPGEVFLGTVHRLDRPVSGVVLYARTSKALERLNEMFRSRDLQKVYWAIVQHSPEKDHDTLKHFLIKDEKTNKSKAFAVEKAGTKPAVLSYETVGRGEHYTFLEVQLETGRHHQIRCQLSSIGCPIRGDLKYGAARSNPDGSISLHARKIEFIHPVKKEKVTIEAPVPAERIWEDFARMAEKRRTN